MSDSLYEEITQDIKVCVVPEPLEESSDPGSNVFSFAYTVVLENMGADTVQLIERHWIINSGGEQIGEVVGPGVVGEQPFLAPGQTFKYTSGAVIHDPVGNMKGTYTFKRPNGNFFEVMIPRFDLVFDEVLH